MTAPKILSNTETQLHSSWKMNKKVHRKQNLEKWNATRQITKMPIRTGLLLSHHLGVRRNMVGNLWGNFYFTKLQTWLIRTGLSSKTTLAIKTNDWRSPGNTNPMRIGLKKVNEHTCCIATGGAIPCIWTVFYSLVKYCHGGETVWKESCLGPVPNGTLNPCGLPLSP